MPAKRHISPKKVQKALAGKNIIGIHLKLKTIYNKSMAKLPAMLHIYMLI